MHSLTDTLANPTSTQMNVRMDKALHKQGVAAFAEIGVSPSEAVRALWRRAAQGGKSLHEVQEMLFPTCNTTTTREDLRILEDGHRIVEEGMRSLGVDVSTWPLDTFPSYEEIEEAARIERLKEEGLV